MKKTIKPPRFKNPYPLVHVLWRDASHSGGDGWTTKETQDIPLLEAEAVGYLVFDGENKWGEACVGLASALVHNESHAPDHCLSFIVPKQMILKMKTLKV